MFAASKTSAASTGGYQISRSLRFNRPDSAYLTRTPATTTNRRTFTLSFWYKQGSLVDEYYAYALFIVRNTGSPYFRLTVTGSQAGTPLQIRCEDSVGIDVQTTQVFRDPSAWYHIVLSIDTTQATAANRVKFYVNGSQVTAFGTATYPAQNADTNVNTTVAHEIGGSTFTGVEYFSGYMTEFNLIDGTQLTPSSFGETNAQTGVWQPKAYSGSYGTNGFYLNFSDNSNTTAATLGKDYSGNGNNWTPNNFSVTAGAGNDSLVDSPTSYGTDTGVGGTVRGNYATWNPVASSSYATLSNGNLDATGNTAADNGCLLATIGNSSGKWYWEETIGTVVTNYPRVGAMQAPATNGIYPGKTNTGVGYLANGVIQKNDTTLTTVASFTTGDVIGMALDLDNLTLAFYKNNTLQYTATALPTGTYFSGVGEYNGSTSTVNFGQRPFAYTAPSGYKALCTQNLPTPTIGATTATQAGKYFNAVTYTGTGSSLGVTGVGFQPDFVWVKGRSGATDHALYDAVRGVQKQLESNTTTAETTETTGITAFGSDGFTTGALAQLNTSSATYVAWNWKANGSGSTNTAGSITSTVSANTTSGFSVVTFTAQSSGTATVGHGLGVAPSMIITKTRVLGESWYTYHASLGAGTFILLNTSAASTASTVMWNNTSPTSSVFSMGTNWAGVGTMVAYCFAEVAGYSKFGSYTGNGSTDGTFVYTGFRPRYVLLKITNSTGNWFVIDTAMNPSNNAPNYLSPNLSDSQGTDNLFDILSNGFKLRNSYATLNGSGNTFIYAAFAENPFKYSLAR